MNNENFHPVLKVPPMAHALHQWDDKKRTLTYEYNGVPLISIVIPGKDEVGFRHGSDGNMQNIPFFQNLYIMVDKPVRAEVTFNLSDEVLNMRPNRAGSEQGIVGQVGRPLIYGINGIYDVKQDLLLHWYGCEWQWENSLFEMNANGRLSCRLVVELGPKPWVIVLRMHYYRKHLGYSYYKPWEWRPDLKPVAGWCSWEACRRNVAAEDIEKFSKFFGRTLKDYGLEYIQLDDGYESLPIPVNPVGTLSEGWLFPNDKFPSGHQGVIDTIRRNGLTPAIWTNANVTNKEFAERNRECFLKDNHGKLLLGEWIDYLLNCTDETLEKHVMPYYKGLSQLGYQYFKTDAIRHLIMDGLHEAVRQGLITNEDAEASFRRFMEYARKGIGDDRYFLASWGVLSEAVGLVDACRIAMDANPTWAGIRMQLVESARWFHTQRILFVNDPDHICARTNIEWLRSVSSLVSLSGGLYMLSDPLECYDEERLDIIKKCLPVLPASAGETGPLDMNYPAFTWTKLHGFAVNSNEKPVALEDASIEDALNMAGIYPTMNDNNPFSTLWTFHIEKRPKQWCVAGRFATVPLKQTQVKLEDIGLNPQDEYIGFDFWEKKYLGRISKTVPFRELGLGQCQILALHKTPKYPQLISSTRHVSMDAVSVQSEEWEGNRLKLVVSGVKGTTESYWVHIPDGYTFTGGDSKGGNVGFTNMPDIVRVDTSFVEGVCEVSLQF